MTSHQLEAFKDSLASLSALDKLELVEHLVHDLRSSVATNEIPPSGSPGSLTEAEFEQQLVQAGLMLSRPTPSGSTPSPDWQPIVIEGEPLSATIIRERR